LRETLAFTQAMAGASATAQRATPAAAFARAQATVRAGQRLDMAQLAAELDIARATLYRWTGDRNRLLGDVLWTEVAAVLEHVRATAPGHGVQRLERGAGMFLDVVAGNPLLVSLLTLEGEGGLRLLTAPAGAVRPRIIAAVAGLIDEECQAGRYRLPAPAALLADGIVSLGERFLYHAGDRALNPDPETAQRVIGLLLREA
jgi:hypothetical protein